MGKWRRQTQGLAQEKKSGTRELVLLLLNAIIFFVAASGLVGTIVFFFVHWTTFS